MQYIFCMSGWRKIEGGLHFLHACRISPRAWPLPKVVVSFPQENSKHSWYTFCGKETLEPLQRERSKPSRRKKHPEAPMKTGEKKERAQVTLLLFVGLQLPVRWYPAGKNRSGDGRVLQ